MLLSEQGHTCVPFSHTLDLSADAPALVCQQDVSGGTVSDPAKFARLTAEGLATIHHRNLGRREELRWLPHAEQAYFEGFIRGTGAPS